MLSGGLQERHARLLRWLLIGCWLALIVSLLIPASPLPGNRIFWGTVVPRADSKYQHVLGSG